MRCAFPPYKTTLQTCKHSLLKARKDDFYAFFTPHPLIFSGFLLNNA